MGYTRRDFVYAALSEIGVSTDTFDVPPERLQECRTRLDGMMATWNAKGVRVGYPLPSGPQTGDLDDETDTPDSAWEAIYTNLAVRIAPIFGKSPTMETKATAKGAYNTLLSLHTFPQERSLQGLPYGAGNKPWRYTWNNFIQPPARPLDAGPDGPIEGL